MLLVTWCSVLYLCCVSFYLSFQLCKISELRRNLNYTTSYQCWCFFFEGWISNWLYVLIFWNNCYLEISPGNVKNQTAVLVYLSFSVLHRTKPRFLIFSLFLYSDGGTSYARVCSAAEVPCYSDFCWTVWGHKELHMHMARHCFYFTFRRIDISPSALRKHTRLAGEERVFKEESQKVGSK